MTGKDRSDVYRPVICTTEALHALSGRSNGRRRLVDVRAELLPLLFGEMYARYYAQTAFQASGQSLPAPRSASNFRPPGPRAASMGNGRSLADRFGGFDAEELFFGHQPEYAYSEDYERFVYQAFADDLREAEVPDGASPVKSAAQVFRIFRDPMRSVVELGGFRWTRTWTSMPTSAAGSTVSLPVRRPFAHASCSL